MQSEATEGALCVANISDRERQRRLMFGGIQFGLAMIVLAALVVSGVNLWWRLALFPIFFGAANAFFQWRDKT